MIDALAIQAHPGKRSRAGAVEREVRAVVEEAQRQGWRLEVLRSGHPMLLAPDNSTKVVLPGTPSDRRFLPNGIALMRRAGFRWPPGRVE